MEVHASNAYGYACMYTRMYAYMYFKFAGPNVKNQVRPVELFTVYFITNCATRDNFVPHGIWKTLMIPLTPLLSWTPHHRKSSSV